MSPANDTTPDKRQILRAVEREDGATKVAEALERIAEALDDFKALITRQDDGPRLRSERRERERRDTAHDRRGRHTGNGRR